MATHAVPWLVAALLLRVWLRTMLLRLVAAHAGVGVHGADARVEAGEVEDVAVGEGAQAQEVPRHTVAGASPSASTVPAAAAVGRGGGASREPLLLRGQAGRSEPEGGAAGRAARHRRTGHLGVMRASRARAADGRAHLRRLLQQRRGRQVRRGGGGWRPGRDQALGRGGVAERLQQRVLAVVGHRRPRRHLCLHGVAEVLLQLLRLRLHNLLVVVVLVLLERGELLVLLHHRLRLRREEQRVVRRCGLHGVEADGLGALLRQRVAEGAVRDEAVPPACDDCIRKHKKRSNL
jgi:hypothetical protein